MSDADVELVRRAVLAFELDPEPDRFSEFFDPEYAEIVPLRAALEDVVYAGRDAPRQFVHAAAEEWESLSAEPREVRRVGERILALMTLHARSRGAGLELDLEIAGVFTVRDGRIVRLHTFLDPADAIREVEAEG